jgi:hypothetical protein
MSLRSKPRAFPPARVPTRLEAQKMKQDTVSGGNDTSNVR